MPSRRTEIRDPIHGTICLNQEETRVLDHPLVQRLRHIRQLGFVSLVYPGAVHDRLQHSVGVCHLAGRAFDALLADECGVMGSFDSPALEYAKRVIRFAGLLHDLGHAAFSHTAEAFLGPIEGYALPDDWYRDSMVPKGRKAHHEDCTLRLVYALACDGVLDHDVARDVCAVLSPLVRRSSCLNSQGSLVSILRSLVSGELDVDREDYLLRDSHFAGVSYGLFDLNRLLDCLTTVDGQDGPELALDGDGIHAFEGLLMARYHMFLQVYFHKTPPCFEYYLRQAVEAGEINLNLHTGIEGVIASKDTVVHEMLAQAAAAGGQWSRRIVEREPSRLVLRERVGEADVDNSLSIRIYSALQDAGCRTFIRHSRQRFCSILGAGGRTTGDRLLCTRSVLRQRRVSSITEHSHLLSAFNRPIDMQYMYVLREDADRAEAVIKSLRQ